LAPLVGKNRFVDSIAGESHKIMAANNILDGGLPEVPAGEGIVEFGAPTAASGNEFPGGELPPSDAGTGVRVGLVDTPMSYPAQEALSVETQDALVDSFPPKPTPYRAGHSEFVASLIRRQAPAASLFLKGVIDPESGRANSWKTAQAIVQLVAEHHVDILNLSLGCFAATGPPFVITRAIERVSPQVLVVAAAGNHGDVKKWVLGRTSKSAVWPAAMPPVIAVGAHGENDQAAPSWSPNLSWVACTAPGVNVLGRYLEGHVELAMGPQEFQGFARWSGTSFAAATVTGAIAAQTRPGSVSPKDAYESLLKLGGIVRKFKLAPSAADA
jgi:membrane-anchored mycosin MYCP